MTSPVSPTPKDTEAERRVVERVAVALADEADDGCFHIDGDDEMYEANREDRDYWLRLAARAVLAASPAVTEGERAGWPLHWTLDQRADDLHARWHDQRGNMIGRDECGWEPCEFWQSARFALAEPFATFAASPAVTAAEDEK